MTSPPEVTTAGAGFNTSLDHLLAELRRVDLKLRRRVLQIRLADEARAGDEFRGLYVSTGEVDSIVAGSFPPSSIVEGIDDTTIPALRAITDSLERLEWETKRRAALGLERGTQLRLRTLARVFGLSEFDRDVLLLCLLPEMDLRYERLYAYLQDDVSKKRPTVDLVLQVLCPSLEQRLAAREAFAPEAPLMKHHLIRLTDGGHDRSAPFLSRFLDVDQRIVSYLWGHDHIDAHLASFAELVHPRTDWGRLVLPEGLREKLEQVLARRGDGILCYLQGPYGVGRRSTAEAVCRQSGSPLLVIDLTRLVNADLPFETAVELSMREASLEGAALYWHGLDVLASENKPSRDDLLRRVAGWPGITFLSGETPWAVKGWQAEKPVVTIELPVPLHTLRKRLWQAHLDGIAPTDDELTTLADKFHFTGGQIRDAVATATGLALSRGQEADDVTVTDLYQACRTQSNQNLSTLARKIQPRYDWDDIVLPKDQMAQLHEICSQVKYRNVVYEEWSFGHKASLGRGLNIVFAGPSGTGKTMASEIIARELGLDLYRIDLSSIVSKYIGETEKNLDRVFHAGRDSNAILLFDEADALFGKRSEVRDSHDRYANIEIAYLLQKMEEYEGTAILATNLRKNVDEAFARRMHFAIEFPFPEEQYRYGIWKRVFPADAPVAEDVDFSFLARQLKVTGGNIKNIALAAAFLAAAGPSAITMEHVIKGAKREYQKIGKLCTETDFARYFDLVKA